MDVVSLRLQNHHLLNPDFLSPEGVVGHFGAVQAQDFGAALWSLGLRQKNPSREMILRAYDEGKILRTHIMRPTWHFVLPQDVLWLQQLTSGNVKRKMATYNRKLELTEELLSKTSNIITKALKNKNYLTRREIKIMLTGAGIKTDVQRLAHIVSRAELDGLIVSGPIRGKQFTYALASERISKPLKLDRDESLGRLTMFYFSSHGPAQIKDFAWWSGMNIKDAQRGIDLSKEKLASQQLNNKTYWYAHKNYSDKTQNSALLLSIYDEYTIAYSDRSDISDKRDIENMISNGNLLTAVIIINGKVAGTWKKIEKKISVEIGLRPYKKINREEKKLLDSQISKLGTFLGREVKRT